MLHQISQTKTPNHTIKQQVTLILQLHGHFPRFAWSQALLILPNACMYLMGEYAGVPGILSFIVGIFSTLQMLRNRRVGVLRFDNILPEAAS